LQFGVKDVDRAAKDVSSLQVSMIRTNTGPEFIWSKTTERVKGDPVVYPDSVVHRECPEINFATEGPVKHEMEEIRARHTTDGLDATFSYTILMVSTNTSIGDLLLLTGAMILEFLGGKNTVVGMICFHLNIDVSSFSFKTLFGTDGGGGCELGLRVVEDFATCMVNVDGTTRVSM
jgi:hypothetical protein